MDLEQHIKNLKDYIRIDKDNIAYDDSNFAQFCKGHCEDIQAVLDELDNRIPRKDIEDKKRKCENRRFSDFTNEPNFAVERNYMNYLYEDIREFFDNGGTLEKFHEILHYYFENNNFKKEE